MPTYQSTENRHQAKLARDLSQGQKDCDRVFSNKILFKGTAQLGTELPWLHVRVDKVLTSTPAMAELSYRGKKRAIDTLSFGGHTDIAWRVEVSG